MRCLPLHGGNSALGESPLVPDGDLLLHQQGPEELSIPHRVGPWWSCEIICVCFVVEHHR